MTLPQGALVTFTNYKCFGESEQGLTKILPVNVIVGRNNAGKSALLDMIDYAVSPGDLSAFAHDGAAPMVYVTTPLPNETVDRVFHRNTSSGDIPGSSDYDFGKQFLTSPVKFRLADNGAMHYVESDPAIPVSHQGEVGSQTANPFATHVFKRVYAERDIKVEEQGPPVLRGDGSGATNLIHFLINDASADHTLVERTLLDSLNGVFAQDTNFSRIRTKRLEGGDRWEVFLDEEEKGSIALSASGSGLKTILIVLCHLLLLPAVERRSPSDYLFGFEELENNLHPGLQRRLFSFMRQVAIDRNMTVFLTTHSNVVIDLFSGDAQAQLVHVKYEGGSAHVVPMLEYGDGHHLLDDLDVRASDLLQSNGIIWVEGPSDRTYINRYLELVFEGRYREGTHYQCMFYGGRLLARVTADPGDSTSANLLRVNRHCAVVIDRDTDDLNDTKLRIIGEVEAVGGHVWVTDKKEIECSIPVAAIRAHHGNDRIDAVAPMEPYDEYLSRVIDEATARAYLRHKILYAEGVCGQITRDMIEADAALLEHVHELGGVISGWNSEPAPT